MQLIAYLIKTESYISAVEIHIFYHKHTAVVPVYNESSQSDQMITHKNQQKIDLKLINFLA